MEILEQDNLIDQARLLARRMERLSADSIWARRASGYRASLLKAIDQAESANQESNLLARNELVHLQHLLVNGFSILENAAREHFRTWRKPV